MFGSRKSLAFALALAAFVPSAFAVSDLLGGSPLSTSSPPFASREHDQKPTDFWGSIGDNAPLQTNSWWENLVLDTGENTVMVMPFEVRALADGLHTSMPGKQTEATFVLSTFNDNFHFGASESMGSRTISNPDLLSVTLNWSGGLEVPLVRGAPYVTLKYTGLTPVLTTIHAIISVNGDSPGSHSGSKFAVELNNGQTWIFYTSSDVTINAGGSVVTFSSAFSGSLRAAVAITGASESDLDLYADKIPVGCSVSASSSGDTATYEFNWETEGSGDLLMMALPHHVDTVFNVLFTNVIYNTIKGDAVGVVGDKWSLSEDLTTVTWFSPNGIDSNRLDDIKNALNEDLSLSVQAGDPYFGGKQMAKLARLALIAEEAGEDGLAQQFRDKVRPVLESWLDATNSDPLVYDSTWGGICATAGMDDPNADFGQGYYNDHHFHYGYHIYTAAVLAKADPSWADDYEEPLYHMIRDIAEPSGQDPYYTQTRQKDWYAGHSWANGIYTAFGDSHNQESTSESVNAWYSLYLFGEAVGDDRVRDLGRLALATELRTAHKYWQITSEDNIYESPFAENKVVGILWSTKVDYATWFGGNVEFIHCIQMLPFTPISEDLLRPNWIEEEYPVLSPAMSTADEGWRGYIIMAHGVIDKEAAWAEAAQLNAYDDGNSRSNTLYWLATRP